MAPQPHPSFTPECKAETVQLVRTSGKSISQICRDLELTETAAGLSRPRSIGVSAPA